MTLRRVRFFYKICFLVVIARIRRIQLLPTAFHRTQQQQADLYAIGRTTELDRRPVTACDGTVKRSKHQIWEAMDFCIYKDGLLVWKRIPEYNLLGKIAKRLGLRHGGNWDGDDQPGEVGEYDIYHFELL